MEALENSDYKMQFAIRNAKVKIFRSVKTADDRDPVGTTNELLNKMKINCPMWTDEPSTQADHVEGRADKSVALEVRSN